MCDIYQAECEECSMRISIHIGDFSCSRNNIKVWCPHCAKKATPPTKAARRIEEDAQWCERGQCWEGADSRDKWQKIKTAVIFCGDPRGHDIHLN